jgi:hypothetical protein
LLGGSVPSPSVPGFVKGGVECWRIRAGEQTIILIMTKYEEIKEAAVAGERLFRERQNRCLQYGVLLWRNFASYCGIPSDQIRMWRWNGSNAEPVFEDAEAGYLFAPAGAMKFDEESQSWRFGLQIRLGALGWVLCRFGVADSDGKALVEVAGNKARVVDFSDENQRKGLYDYVVEVIKECYREGNPRQTIGFSLPAVEGNEVEPEEK